MCTALYMMVLYDRARVGPTTKTSDEISIICLFRLILQANPLFCFELWYSSCFEVKCWIHTFPKRCSHISMWILILLDHRGRHVNSFSTGVLLFKWIRSFQHPQDQVSVLLNGVCFIRLQVAFVFPAHPPFFFKDSDFLIKYPFIHVKSLHSFRSMFWSGDSSWRCSRASSSSSFVLFLLRWIHFKISVLIIFLSSCQMLSHAGAPLNHPLLAIHLFRSAEDISSCHSRSVQPISRLLSHSSHLIQPVQYLLSSNHFNGVSFEWALTHRSFPRILPDSSNFPGAIPKFFSKFDVRMNYHQSNAFLQDLSNSFHCWLNLFAFDSSGVPQ